MKTEKIDGLDSLIELFPNKSTLVQYLIENCLFFSRKMVATQAYNISKSISEKKPIPTYYQSPQNNYIKVATNYKLPPNRASDSIPHLPLKSKKVFDNPLQAYHFTREPNNRLYDRTTDLPIIFDKDKFNAVKDAIFQITNHYIYPSKNQTISNYELVEIWRSSKLEEYSQLWRFVLVPTHLKSLFNSNNEISKTLFDIIHAITIELYRSNSQGYVNNAYSNSDNYLSSIYRKMAERMINDGLVKFIPIIKEKSIETILEEII